MRLRLLQSSLRRRDILLRGLDRGMRSLEIRNSLIAGLCTCNSLFCQRYRARGVCPLMLEVRLRLQERGLTGLYLRLRIDGGT